MLGTVPWTGKNSSTRASSSSLLSEMTVSKGKEQQDDASNLQVMSRQGKMEGKKTTHPGPQTVCHQRGTWETELPGDRWGQERPARALGSLLTPLLLRMGSLPPRLSINWPIYKLEQTAHSAGTWQGSCGIIQEDGWK